MPAISMGNMTNCGACPKHLNAVMAVLIHAETKLLGADRILKVNKTKIPIKLLFDVLSKKVPYVLEPTFSFGVRIRSRR